MKKIARSILSLLLVVSMILQYAPVKTFADNDAPNGDGESVKVTIALGKGESPEGVTMPKGDTVPKGTAISRLTTPEKQGYLFKGWYYDEDCTDYAYPNDKLEKDTTLYAAFMSRKVSSTDENGNYVASMDLKDPGFRYVVTSKAPALTDEQENYLTILGIDMGDDVPEWTPSLIEQYAILNDQYSGTRLAMRVTDKGNGVYEITAAEGFTPGRVYQLDLSGAAGLYHVWNGETQLSTVIYHNMSIYREEVMNIKLSDGIRYIPLSQVENMGELEPLLTVQAVDLSKPFDGMDAVESAIAAGAAENIIRKEESKVARTGSFVYKGLPQDCPKVGELVCIYAGTSPLDKVGDMDDFLSEEKATYVRITAVKDNYKYEYELADALDVLDTPVVVPISADADLVKNDGNQLTLPVDAFTFSAKDTLPFTMDGEVFTYERMKLDEKTQVDEGDFFAVYTITDEENKDVAYEATKSPTILKIKEISTQKVKDDNGVTEDRLVVKYDRSSQEELQNTLSVHATQEYDVPKEFVDEHRKEMESLAEKQFEESDKDPLLLGLLTSEQATNALAAKGVDLTKNLAFNKDGKVLNSDLLGTQMLNSSLKGAPLLGGAKSDPITIEAEFKNLDFEPEVYNELTHWDRKGVGFTGRIRGQVEITVNGLQEGKGKINIDFDAALTQEFFIDEDFDVDVDWFLCIPEDIYVTACIDIGSWTNLKAELKLSTGFEDDPLEEKDLKWMKDNPYTEKLFDKMNEINSELLPKLKEGKERWEWYEEIGQDDYLPWEADDKSIVDHIKDEDEDDEEDGPDLSAFEEAYKGILEGVDDTWMQLFKASILELKHSFLGIFCVKLEIGFTFSICGTIQIGFEYNYDYVRRYSATLDVYDFEVTANTTDIQKPHSTFMLYAIGAWGIKPAIYVELAFGFFDTDLDSVSINMEIGVPCILFLYGILTIDNWRDTPVQFQGGLYFKVSLSFEASVGVQVGKGMLSTSKTIYETEIPVVSVGSRYQIRGLADEDEEGNPAIVTSMETNATRVLQTGHSYFDIVPSDRAIYALDMMEGDVVEYYPEAGEFTYEVIPNGKDSKYPAAIVEKMEVGGTPVKKSSKGSWGGEPEHNTSKVNTYERIYLKPDNINEYLDLTIKMTYNPPFGVMVKGQAYTKIIHFTIDNTRNGFTVSYANDFYDQTLNRFLYDHDSRFTEFAYMTGVEVAEENIPKKHPLAKVPGYTVNGWDVYQRPEKLGKPWEKIEAGEEDKYFVIGEDGKLHLTWDLRCTINATPNQQKLHIRHWVRNAEGTGYELVSENDAFTNDKIRSDVMYSYADLHDWGAFKSFNQKDYDLCAKIERVVLHANNAEEGMEMPGTGYYYQKGYYDYDIDQYVPEVRYSYYYNKCAKVTPTDSATAVDIIDCYYERQSYPVRYIAVDEDGNEIRGISENVLYAGFVEGTVVKLEEASFFNRRLGGYEFDGWYDIAEYEALSGYDQDPAGTHRMKVDGITVKYKLKALPVSATVRTQCEADGGLLDKYAKITALSGYYTLAEILEMDNTYTGKEGKKIKDMIPADRTIATDLNKEYHIGGWGWSERRNDNFEDWSDVTFFLNEVTGWPENLKIRLEFVEGDDQPLVEGQHATYKVYELTAAEAGCSHYIPCPEELLNDNIKVAPGWVYNDFYNTWFRNFIPEYEGITLPIYKAEMLTDTDDTHYDAGTNTLTFTIHSHLYTTTIPYEVTYHYFDGDTEDTSRTKTVTKYGFASEVVNSEREIGITAPGYETDWSRTPEEFTVKGDGTTKVDYYLKATRYPFTFVIKNERTGETLYEKKVMAEANSKLWLPEALYPGKNEYLNQAGYSFLRWQQQGGTEYFGNGINSLTGPGHIVATQYSQGTYEAVFTPKEIGVVLHVYDHNKVRLNDSTYKVKYNHENPNGQSYTATKNIKAYQKFTIPTPETADGVVFMGWYDNPEFNGNKITSTELFYETTDLYAKYIDKFDVTFVGNGDLRDPFDDVYVYSCSYHQLLPKPDKDHELRFYSELYGRSNYEFLGWSTEPDGEVIASNTSATPEVTTYYAIWQPKTYQVTFEDKDGGAFAKYEHKYGESTTVAPDSIPTRTGYVFKGWQVGDKVYAASELSFGPYDVTFSKHIKPVWEAETYTITYDTDGGTLPGGAPTSWSYTNKVNVESWRPTKEGATFKGWYIGTHHVYTLDSHEEASNVTLKARWNYKEQTIRYGAMTSDGKPLDEEMYYNPNRSGYFVTDGTLVLSDARSRKEWEVTFDHWELIDREGNATTVTELNLAEYGDGINLRAVFNKVEHYEISFGYMVEDEFMPYEGSLYPEDAYYGETIKAPAPVRSGYIFKGWKSEAYGEELVGTKFEMTKKQDCRFVAVWEKEDTGESVLTINYYKENKEGTFDNFDTKDNVTFYKGSYVYSLLPESLETGASAAECEFDYLTVSGSETKYYRSDALQLASGEYEVNVYYKLKKYTVNIWADRNDPVPYSTNQMYYTDLLELPELPERTGYQFNGWNLDYQDGMCIGDVLREKGGFRYAEEVNIYAKDWTLCEYEITYVNWPEGKENYNPTTFRYGTPNFDLILPTKPGYSIEDITVETEGKTEDITVTLNWVKETYTISYDLGDGTLAASLPQSFTVDSTFEATTLPQVNLKGCRFLGWTVNGETVKKVPVAGIYGDYTVKAEYEPTTYTISIDTNGGTKIGISMTPPSDFTYKDILLNRSYRLPSLEKEGFVFKGWDVFNTLEMTHSTIGMAGILTLQDGMYSNLELTALFEPIPLDFSILTYDLNDSEDFPAMLAEDSVSFFNPMKGLRVEDPSRVGFTFIGWTCDVDLGSVQAGTLVNSLYLNDRNSSQEMKLTAHWKTNAAHMNYQLAGGELETLDKLDVVQDIGSGNYLPDKTTVKNAKIYTILNTFELEDPTRTDGVMFLGWTSDAFNELAIFTNCNLDADTQLALLKGEPIGTAEVEKLINGAPASGAYMQNLWSLKEQGITLTANWADKEYSIIYSLAGGELPEGQANKKSYFNTTDTFTLVNPVRPGYKFLGWKNLVEAIKNPETAPAMTVTIPKGTYGNLEFEAVWEREAYKIQYSLDGGSFDGESSAMTEFTPEDSYLSFGLPKKDGCAFIGWTIKNTTTGETLKENYTLRGIMLSELSDGEAAKFLGDLELTAQWKHLYTSVLADANGGDFHGVTSGDWSFDQAEGVTLKIEDPQRKGCTFDGWEIVGKNKTGITIANVGSGFHTVTIAAGAVDYEGVLLQAKWEASDSWPYTVYLWYRGAVGDDAVRIGRIDGYGKVGTKINVESILPNQIVADDGQTYTFEDVTIDVNYSVNGMLQPEDSEPMITEDTVLDVLVRPAYHKVYFKYSNQEEAEVYAYLMGEKIQEPADIWTAWPGHTFDGWYTDEDCTQKFDFNTPVGKEDVYLYSTYEAIQYQITYNNWPASIPNPNPTSFTVDMEEFFVKYPLINPRTTGYDYGGLGEEELRYRDRINVDGLKDVVIDAPFAIHKYNIIYNYAYSYDDYTKIQTVYDITQRVELANPIAVGCTFKGWKAMCGNTEIALEGSLEEGYAIPAGTTGDIKLIPEFDGEHTITYAGLEGSTFETTNPNPITFSMFDEEFVLQNPEKAGYLFLGWSLDENYPAPYNPLRLPDALYAEDLTATAMWWPIEYTVTFYMSTDGVTEAASYKSENYDIARTYEGSYSLYVEDRFNDGYRFDGWTVTNEEGQTVNLTDDFKLLEGTLGNLTAVANYSTIEYTITYDIGEGEFTNPDSVIYTYKPCEVSPMNPVVLPEVTREDVAFMGWSLVNAGMYLRPQAIDGNYGNMIAIALWDEGDEPQPSDYYIFYSDVDDYDNTDKYPTKYDGSKSITLPDPQAREGYTFIGWSVVSYETGEVTLTNGKTIPAGTTGMLEITALWKKEYVSLFVTMTDGTEVLTTTVPVDQTLTAEAVADLLPAGVIYAVIYDGDTYEEFTAVDVTEQMEQINLILVKNEDFVDLVLTSDLDGVTITGAGQAIVGTSREISVTVPEGYDFLGWYVGENLTYSDATTWITISAENANLIAKFTTGSYGPESYVITIETDGNCTIEVFLVENAGTQGGEQQGTQGGEQQGTQGGEQQGTQGGEQQGTQGGEQQGTQGVEQQEPQVYEQQGTQGGEQQGTQGGEQQGTQGGESGQGEAQGGRVINSGETVWAGATIRVVTTANENYVLTTQPDEFYTVNGPLTLSATADPTAYALTVTHENGAAPTVNVENLSSITRGTTVTLTANAANEGYEFIGWYQPNGKILEKSTTINVVMSKNQELVARYEKTAGIVNFVSNGLIQATVTGNAVTEADFPTVPASPSYGFEFKGWDMTVTEVNQALALGQKVTVNALFAPMKKHMTLNIYNGESETPDTVVFEELQWYQITAAEVSGKQFAYWTLDGELFSYNPLADVRVTQDYTLRAVYSEDVTETLGTAKIIATEYNIDTKKAMFVSLTNLPEEAILQGAGLVAASGNNFDPSTAVLSAANADYVKCGITTGPSINYTWTKSKVEVGDIWYVRAYLVYTLNGEEYTIYGDLVKYVAE